MRNNSSRQGLHRLSFSSFRLVLNKKYFKISCCRYHKAEYTNNYFSDKLCTSIIDG